MRYSFTPLRLNKVKDEIILEHPLVKKIEYLLTKSDDLYELIKRLVSCKYDMLEREAIALSDKQFYQVVAYIPNNFYKVELENLFEIYCFRRNQKSAEILFSEWQEGYDHLDSNELIMEIVLDNDNYFECILENNHIPKHFMYRLLTGNNTPVKFGKFAIGNKEIQNLDIEEKLSYYGIRKDSRLFIDCIRLFYTYCERVDYLKADKNKLLEIIKQYNDAQIKAFIKNILEQLPLGELYPFREIANYLITKTGENHTNKFDVFFSKFDPVLVRKYINWINTIKIEDYFDQDERSHFWKKFEYYHVAKHRASNSIMLEFDDYIAIEFLGQANGPAYIYRKEYFENSNVSKWFRKSMYDNTGMRHQLYNYSDYNNEAMNLSACNGTRLAHTGYWQDKFYNVLKWNNVTRYLNDRL